MTKVLINKADLEEVASWIDTKCNAPHLEVKLAMDKLRAYEEVKEKERTKIIKVRQKKHKVECEIFARGQTKHTRKRIT